MVDAEVLLQYVLVVMFEHEFVIGSAEPNSSSMSWLVTDRLFFLRLVLEWDCLALDDIVRPPDGVLSKLLCSIRNGGGTVFFFCILELLFEDVASRIFDVAIVTVVVVGVCSLVIDDDRGVLASG